MRAARLLTIAAVGLTACVRAPSPLAPARGGSLGLPHRGTLRGGAALADAGHSYRRLRADGRRYGTRAMVGAIERAATAVARAYPGSELVVGDLSAESGGRLLPHLSHRTGRDADLLLYVTTLDGARIASPGFVHFGADGLAWDPTHHRFLRFDVEREWLLVRTLVQDDDARVQWIFLNHALEPMLIEWARSRGESAETVRRAEEVLLEPKPGGVHDDHTHVRVACDDESIARGCEPSGPERDWLVHDLPVDPPPSTDELLREFARGGP